MITRVLFTPLLLNSIQPKAKEYTLYDAKLNGLGLRVQPSGAASWIVLMREGTATRRLTLGPRHKLDLEAARRLAQKRLAGEVQALPPKPQTTITFKELTKRFVAAKQGVYQQSTLKHMNVPLQGQLIPLFGNQQVGRITSPDIARWFYDYSQTSPGGANQAKGLFTTMFHWAQESGILPYDLSNPARPIKANKRRARGQMLNTDQIKGLLLTLDGMSAKYFDAMNIIRLILYTGCRSGEILRLKWADVERDRLALSTTKTGPRDVILSGPANTLLAVLREAKAYRAVYVFPSRMDSTKPRSNIDAAWVTIKQRAGIAKTFRLHDLRHTYASHAVLTGESMAVTGSLLGHRSQRSTEIYTHLDHGVAMDSAEVVARGIVEALGGGDAG